MLLTRPVRTSPTVGPAEPSTGLTNHFTQSTTSTNISPTLNSPDHIAILKGIPHEFLHHRPAVSPVSRRKSARDALGQAPSHKRHSKGPRQHRRAENQSAQFKACPVMSGLAHTHFQDGHGPDSMLVILRIKRIE